MHSHRLLNRFPHFAGWSAFAAAEAVVALVLGGKAFPFCFLAFFYSGSPLFLARASFFYGPAEFPTFLSRVRSFLILRSRAPVLGEVSGRESEFLAARASVIEGDVCESSLVASFALPCSVCVLSLGGVYAVCVPGFSLPPPHSSDRESGRVSYLFAYAVGLYVRTFLSVCLCFGVLCGATGVRSSLRGFRRTVMTAETRMRTVRVLAKP